MTRKSGLKSDTGGPQLQEAQKAKPGPVLVAQYCHLLEQVCKHRVNMLWPPVSLSAQEPAVEKAGPSGEVC